MIYPAAVIQDAIEKYGMTCTIVSCHKCGRILDESSGDDCPDHTLPCCGGKGTLHVTGCTSDPMYQAGMRWATERERVFLDAILNEPTPG